MPVLLDFCLKYIHEKNVIINKSSVNKRIREFFRWFWSIINAQNSINIFNMSNFFIWIIKQEEWVNTRIKIRHTIKITFIILDNLSNFDKFTCNSFNRLKLMIMKTVIFNMKCLIFVFTENYFYWMWWSIIHWYWLNCLGVCYNFHTIRHMLKLFFILLKSIGNFVFNCYIFVFLY